MFCNHCGKQIPDHAKFCNFCGNLNAAAPNEPVAESPAVTPPAVEGFHSFYEPETTETMFSEKETPTVSSSHSFCANCGAPMAEGFPFCGKCGAGEAIPTPISCTHCGAIMQNHMKFCNSCGAPAPAKKHYCSSCGQELDAEHSFCIQCGTPIGSRRSSFSAGTGSASSAQVGKNALSQTFSRWTSRIGGELAQPAAASLGWKHLLAGSMFVLMILFWFLPAFKLEIPYLSLFSSKSDSLYLSIANPLGNETISSYLDLASAYDDDIELIQGLFGVLAFCSIIPFILAAIATLMPIFKKNVLKRRRLIWAKYVAITSFLNIPFWRLFWMAVEIEADGDLEVALSFGGWFTLLFDAALIVLLFFISYENKKYHQGASHL